MRRLITLFVFAVLNFGSVASAQERYFVRELPFSDPQNIAQEVADLVVIVGSPTLYDWESEDGHIRYYARMFSDFGRIYEVEVGVYNDGRRDLKINFYLTNRDFVGKSPKDIIADELIWGQPKIHQELHIWDNGVDGKTEIYQMFSKRNGGVWHGFTRAERDLGKKAGVKQYLYMNGEVYQERRFWWDGWSDASQSEEEEIQNGYKEHLEELKYLLTR